MARNLAILIGINHYEDKSLKALKYARRDAELMQEFLEKDANFSACIFYNDLSGPSNSVIYSPDFQRFSTRPRRTAIRKFLQQKLEPMKPEDNLWFFFSGHGIRDANQDYLMPEDGDPDDPRETGILLTWVVERLRGCNAGQIVLIVDACRQEIPPGKKGQKFGYGTYQGVTIIFSCTPGQSSWEIDAIEQGSFTFILLKCFRQQNADNYFTVSETSDYLSEHVPKLNRLHHKKLQIPRIQVDPIEVGQQALLPQYAKQIIKRFKEMAKEAEREGDLVTASIHWREVLNQAAISEPEYIEAMIASKNIGQMQSEHILELKNSIKQAEAENNFDLAIKLWIELSETSIKYGYPNIEKIKEETFKSIQEIGRKKNEKIAQSKELIWSNATETNSFTDITLPKDASVLRPEVYQESLASIPISNSVQIAPRTPIPWQASLGCLSVYFGYTITSYILYFSPFPPIAFLISGVLALLGIMAGINSEDNTGTTHSLKLFGEFFKSEISAVLGILGSIIGGGACLILGWFLAWFLVLCGVLGKTLSEVMKALGSSLWFNAFNSASLFFEVRSIYLFKFLNRTASWAWSIMQFLPSISVWILLATTILLISILLTFSAETLRIQFLRKNHITFLLTTLTILGMFSGWALATSQSG